MVKSVYKYSPPYIYMEQEDYPSVKPLEFIADDINNSDFHCFIFIRNMQSSFVDLLKRNGAVDISISLRPVKKRIIKNEG